MSINDPFNNNKKQSKNYLLRGGEIINLKRKALEKKDILINGKVIEKIGENLKKNDSNTEIIDCKNLLISPGLVDMRVNIGEPGLEHKETIKSVSMSATSGGVTSLLCMPNTSPPIDQPAIIQSIQRKAREVALSKIFCTGCITRGFLGKEICELQLMEKSGALGFTDGLRTVEIGRAHVRTPVTA